MTDVDLDSYRDDHDLAPDEPAPRAPEGQPHEILDDYKLWQFEAEESGTVPDTYVVARRPDPLDFRMWVFAGRGPRAEFVIRASHKYGPEEVVAGEQEDCCEVLLAGESLAAEHCPEEVSRLVADRTPGEVVTPEPSANDHGGPINY